MTEIKTRGAGLKKQRSLQLDDETFALVEAAEQRTGMSKSAIIGGLIWDKYGDYRAPGLAEREDHAVEAIEQARRPSRRTQQVAADIERSGSSQTAALKTPLPDESATSFKVAGNQVQTARSKADTVLSDSPQRRRKAPAGSFDL